MHYDHISFHHDEHYPQDLPPQNAAHHMGFFFAWAVSQNLHSPAAAQLPDFEHLSHHRISGADFILSRLNGGLDETCFNELGNRFAQYYYHDEEEGYGHFLNDYFLALHLQSEADFYRTENTIENQNKLNPVFQAAFERWKQSLSA